DQVAHSGDPRKYRWKRGLVAAKQDFRLGVTEADAAELLPEHVPQLVRVEGIQQQRGQDDDVRRLEPEGLRLHTEEANHEEPRGRGLEALTQLLSDLVHRRELRRRDLRAPE